MSVIPVRTGPAYWNGPRGYWRPNGRLVLVNWPPRKHNPEDWESKATWGARVFVGLSVTGSRRKFKVQDVLGLVKRRWKRGASFVAQKGLWPSKLTGKLLPEDSVQVILLNLHGATAVDFRREVVALAEALCGTFRQEEVVIEIQRNGIVKTTLGVIPKR